MESARNTILKDHHEYFQNNFVLTKLALDAKLSDGSLKAVTKLAKGSSLPGKSGDKAKLGFEAENIKGQKGRVVGWEMSNKNYFKVQFAFDKKDKLSEVITDNLFWE